jgi:UDP-glucose 6-dehydrogenase
MVGLDKRIGHSHSKVPGDDGMFGWGSHCLDKDNCELEKFSQSSLVRFILNLNKIHRYGDS